MIELDVVVEGPGRVTGAFGLGASPRTPPAPAVPRVLRGVPGWACVVLRRKLADSGTRGAGHPSDRWIPFFPSLLSIGAWRGAHRRRARRYGLVCGRLEAPAIAESFVVQVTTRMRTTARRARSAKRASRTPRLRNTGRVSNSTREARPGALGARQDARRRVCEAVEGRIEYLRSYSSKYTNKQD